MSEILHQDFLSETIARPLPPVLILGTGLLRRALLCTQILHQLVRPIRFPMLKWGEGGALPPNDKFGMLFLVVQDFRHQLSKTVPVSLSSGQMTLILSKENSVTGCPTH